MGHSLKPVRASLRRAAVALALLLLPTLAAPTQTPSPAAPGDGSLVIGTLAIGTNRAVALGPSARAESWSSIAIGDGARASSGDGVAIGHNALTGGHPSIAGGAGIETTAIGEKARAEGWRCTAIGSKAVAGVVSATAIGRGSYAWGAHMIAIGRGAYMEVVSSTNGVVSEISFGNGCGIAGDSLWLGGLMCHKYLDRSGDNFTHEVADGGDGKKRWDVATMKPGTYTIHAQDAFDARFVQDPGRFDAAKYRKEDTNTWTHRVDQDVAGGSLHLAAGRGTGTAPGGVIELQTAPAGNISQNRKNPLKTAIRVDTDYVTEDATPMWLWDNRAKKLKRVFVGPPDSAGPGRRALSVEN